MATQGRTLLCLVGKKLSGYLLLQAVSLRRGGDLVTEMGRLFALVERLQFGKQPAYIRKHLFNRVPRLILILSIFNSFGTDQTIPAGSLKHTVKEMPAKMPTAYIANPPVPVSRLPIGETSYVTFTEIIVDEKDLSTYLRSTAKLRNENPSTVKIRHDEDGYCLVLHDASLRFSLQIITGYTDLIPIVAVIEEIEPGRFEQTGAALQQTKELVDDLGAGARPVSRAAMPAAEPGAAMPFSRITPPQRLLFDLEIDQTGYVDFTAVRVDEKNGSAYIQKNAALHPEPHALNVTVTRRADGYHLTLHHRLSQFTPGKISDYSTVIPAIEVNEEQSWIEGRPELARTGGPSFWKVLLNQIWLMVKIMVPICLWGAFILWVCYPHVLAMSLSLSGSLLAALIIQIAWSDYKRKQRDWSRNQQAK